MTVTMSLPVRVSETDMWGESPPDALGVELVQMGVRPFEPDSVHAYKAAQVKRHTTWWRFDLQELRAYVKDAREHSDDDGLLVNIVFSLVVVAGVAGVVSFFNPLLPWWTYALVAAAALGVAGRMLWIEAEDFGLPFIRRDVAYWDCTAFDEFAGRRPEQINRIAERVRLGIPGAKLSVLELRRGEEVLDPFLLVSRGTHSHYIEVWDEAGFVVEPNPVTL